MKRFFQGVVLGSATAAAVVAAGVALAGTGVGGIFNLGQLNTVNAASALSGSPAGNQLVVANTNAAGTAHALYGYGRNATNAANVFQNAGGGPAMSLLVTSGKAPFTTNSAVKVANLNTDRLDGLDSTALTKANQGAGGGGRVRLSAANLGLVTRPVLTNPGLGQWTAKCFRSIDGSITATLHFDAATSAGVDGFDWSGNYYGTTAYGPRLASTALDFAAVSDISPPGMWSFGRSLVSTGVNETSTVAEVEWAIWADGDDDVCDFWVASTQAHA